MTFAGSRFAFVLFLSLVFSTAAFAQADLQVVKTGPDRADELANVSYDVSVTNLGPNPAATVALTDTIPPGMTFVSATQNTGPTFNCTNPLPNTVSCTTATMLAGETATFTFVFQIDNAQDPGAELTNTATVSSPTPDPDTDNNSSSVTTTIAFANLSVVKEGPANATPGSQISYTITVFNGGPDDIRSVLLQDSFSTDLSFVSVTQDSGPSFNCTNPTPTTVECTIADFAVGLSAVFTLVLDIDPATPPGTVLTNLATVSSATFDTFEEDNTSSIATTTPPAQQADLAVTKSGPAAAPPGGNVVYTITLSNLGPNDAADVNLFDTLPGDMTFVSLDESNDPAMSCSTPPVGSGGTVICTAATFPANQTVTLTLTGQIPPQAASGTVYTNGVSVPPSELPGSPNDPNEENNDAITSLTVSSVDVAVVKTGPAAVNAGTNIDYTLTITNTGPDMAFGVTLTDQLPEGTTLVSFTRTDGDGPPANCDPVAIGSNATIVCNFDLPMDASVVYALTINADDTTAITNTANVTTTDSFDTDLSDNSDSVDTTITPQADLQVTKSGPPTVTAGSDVTYTVSVVNNGPSTATSVTLTDLVPANTTFVSAAQNSGLPFSCDSTITCTIASFPDGATATFTFVVHVSPSATGSIDNTATIGATTADPAGGNNSSMVNSTIVTSANLSVTKTAPPNAVPGQNISYDVTVNNAGPSDALNVTLTDLVPANTTFVSATQNSGPTFSCNSTITCTIAVMPASATATFTFVFAVSPAATGTIENSATVSSTTADPAGGNNTFATSTPTGASADVSVSKSGPATVTAGSNATYTVIVDNAGPSVATNVTLTDTLPANSTFVSQTQNSGPSFNCTPPAVGATGSIVCTIASLAPASPATFTFVVNANPGASGPLDNTATVSSTTTDPNAGNNTAMSTTGIDAGPTDLSITKTANGDRFPAGGVVTYTITATNNGPSVAFGTTVTDVLPAGTTLESATPSQGNCTGTTTVVCNLGTLLVSSSATITLVVRLPLNEGSVSNTATVAAVNAETSGGNNFSTAALAVVSDIPSLSVYGLMLLAVMMAFAGWVTTRMH